jgi:hypothetical protein
MTEKIYFYQSLSDDDMLTLRGGNTQTSQNQTPPIVDGDPDDYD